MFNNKRKKGFTLMELVIVIAVIAILAAVLIPTFTSVIKNSKESAAMQGARNAMETVATEDAENYTNYDYIILSDAKYYEAKAGQFNTTAVTALSDLSTGYQVIVITDGAVAEGTGKINNCTVYRKTHA